MTERRKDAVLGKGEFWKNRVCEYAVFASRRREDSGGWAKISDVAEAADLEADVVAFWMGQLMAEGVFEGSFIGDYPEGEYAVRVPRGEEGKG